VRRLPILVLLPLLLACPGPEPEPEPPPPHRDDLPWDIEEAPLTRFVDPMVGTEGSGNVIPGALVPHGMVRASPDTVGDAGDVNAYDHDATHVEGFSHLHLEGPGGGANGYSQLLLLPQTGPLVVHRSARPSAFDHATEEARPGYYAVTLDDYDVRIEMTATGHAAVHRVHFPAGPGRLILDLGHSMGDSAGGELTLDGRVLHGYGTWNVHPVASLLSGGDGTIAFTTVHFRIELTETPVSTGVFEGAGNNPDVDEGYDWGRGADLGGWAEFDFDAPTTVEVRMGLSLIDQEQALANLDAEVGERSFDEVAAEADAAWNSVLNRVQLDGDDEQQLRTFYTALYRTFFQPADYTEAGGRYAVGTSGAHVVRQADDFRFFTDDWCTWDTFRTSHPLATLVEPERRDDVIRSLLVMHDEGGWLPKCSWNATGYSRVMIGNHAVSLIADARVKGLDRFDDEHAWQAIDKLGTQEIPDLPDTGCGYVNQGTPPDYLELGYVPTECDSHQSVSMTLEHAYDDWATARFAEAVGRDADAARYDERGGYWANHWNPETGFMQARDRAGDWVEPFDPTDDSDANDFCEADSWIYSWFVPHDVPALVDAMGGTDAFVARLDAFFDEGHFDPSNQPSFHVPWLYAAAGRPAGTWTRVPQIARVEYGDGVHGLPGNDDAGSTSAWLVLAMLGIYPIAPGDGVWTLGVPMVSGATVHLHPGWYGGGTTRIEVVGDLASQPNVAAITWNGEPILDYRIDHATLTSGGVLEFVLE
jgi:predicted alpha-1,2-mannosidase